MPKPKRKHRQQKPTVQPDRTRELMFDILSGIISGLITAAVIKLLGW